MIEQHLLKILACPACRSELQQVRDILICRDAKCALRFPICNGIPVMLVEDAKQPQTVGSDITGDKAAKA